MGIRQDTSWTVPNKSKGRRIEALEYRRIQAAVWMTMQMGKGTGAEQSN